MIEISRDEAIYIRENYQGYKCPFIHTTGKGKPANRKHRYIEESREVMRLINEFNKNQNIK
jgi:hypothetical protein